MIREIPYYELKIDKEMYFRILDDAAEKYPEEACGILLRDKYSGNICDIRIMKNKDGQSSAKSHFYIDPLEVYRLEMEAEKDNKEIAAFYHSHPDKEAVLSAEDERYMIPKMVYIIVPVTSGLPRTGRAYLMET